MEKESQWAFTTEMRLQLSWLIHLIKIIDTHNVGLYRDDSLILLKNQIEQQTYQIRKETRKIFKDIGFKIEI